MKLDVLHSFQYNDDHQFISPGLEILSLSRVPTVRMPWFSWSPWWSWSSEVPTAASAANYQQLSGIVGLMGGFSW